MEKDQKVKELDEQIEKTARLIHKAIDLKDHFRFKADYYSRLVKQVGNRPIKLRRHLMKLKAEKSQYEKVLDQFVGKCFKMEQLEENKIYAKIIGCSDDTFSVEMIESPRQNNASITVKHGVNINYIFAAFDEIAPATYDNAKDITLRKLGLKEINL